MKKPHRQDLCCRCKGMKLSCDATYSFKYIVWAAPLILPTGSGISRSLTCTTWHLSAVGFPARSQAEVASSNRLEVTRLFSCQWVDDVQVVYWSQLQSAWVSPLFLSLYETSQTFFWMNKITFWKWTVLHPRSWLRFCRWCWMLNSSVSLALCRFKATNVQTCISTNHCKNHT